MSEMQPFAGFPKAGIKFLKDLAKNNERDWFNANKQTYLDQVQTPAVDLVVSLGTRLKSISPEIMFDTRTNGTGSMMRIYRDTRFSKDKTPYKTNVAMSFWEGPSKKESYSGFFLRVEPAGVSLFTGGYNFGKEILAAFRDAVANDRLGGELVEAIAQVEDAGDYTIGNEHYKRVPRGFDPENPRANLLKYNGLYAFTELVGKDSLNSPDLVDICYEHFANMAPLHHWLVRMARR